MQIYFLSGKFANDSSVNCISHMKLQMHSSKLDNIAWKMANCLFLKHVSS